MLSHVTLFGCLLGTDFVAMAAIERRDPIVLMCCGGLSLRASVRCKTVLAKGATSSFKLACTMLASLCSIGQAAQLA